MAKRISQLTQLTAVNIARTDLLPIVDVSAGQTKYVTVQDLTGLPDVGWTATAESWSYASGTTITVPTNATTKYKVGNFIKITQSTGGTKYGILTTVAATLLTVRWLNGATLANEAITSPQYSQSATPFGVPGIGAEAIDFATTGVGGIWWEELGRTTLTGSGDSLSVQNLPDRKYLRVYITYSSTGGTVDGNMRLNNDSGSNYGVIFAGVGTTPPTTSTSQTSLIVTGATTVVNQLLCIDILNRSGFEKLIRYDRLEGGTAGAGTAPGYSLFVGKWANTANPVSRIDLLNLAGSGDFPAGTQMVVLGHN